jgi:hypothetical protein
VKKAQPKIVTKKPVVKASGPAVKIPVAPATPANSPSQSVAADGGFWSSLTLPMVLLLNVLMAAAILLLVAGGRALLTRAMARKRARYFESGPPESWLERRLAQQRLQLHRLQLHRLQQRLVRSVQHRLEPVSELPPEQLPEPLSEPLPAEPSPRQPGYAGGR